MPYTRNVPHVPPGLGQILGHLPHINYCKSTNFSDSLSREIYSGLKASRRRTSAEDREGYRTSGSAKAAGSNRNLRSSPSRRLTRRSSDFGRTPELQRSSLHRFPRRSRSPRSEALQIKLLIWLAIAETQSWRRGSQPFSGINPEVWRSDLHIQEKINTLPVPLPPARDERPNPIPFPRRGGGWG